MFVFFFQVGKRSVRIDFRGDNAGVPEEFFDSFELSTVVEHGRGESVAQHVRTLLLLRGDEREIMLHHGLHLGFGHPFAFVADEQGGVVGWLFKTHPAVEEQLLMELGTEGYDALLVALAGYLQLPGGQIGGREV